MKRKLLFSVIWISTISWWLLTYTIGFLAFRDILTGAWETVPDTLNPFSMIWWMFTTRGMVLNYLLGTWSVLLTIGIHRWMKDLAKQLGLL